MNIMPSPHLRAKPDQGSPAALLAACVQSGPTRARHAQRPTGVPARRLPCAPGTSRPVLDELMAEFAAELAPTVVIPPHVVHVDPPAALCTVPLDGPGTHSVTSRRAPTAAELDAAAFAAAELDVARIAIAASDLTLAGPDGAVALRSVLMALAPIVAQLDEPSEPMWHETKTRHIADIWGAAYNHLRAVSENVADELAELLLSPLAAMDAESVVTA